MPQPAPRSTDTDNSLAIDLRDVTKVYKGKVFALQGVEMRVRRGEIFGLLGPNGAGKSTLVKIMMTVVRPTTAHGTLLGQPVGNKAALARVGYLPENHRFPRYLTGRQCVEFFGALAKIDRPTRKRRAAELIETVGMTAAADRKIATYSKGMAQRIGLAQSLINDPDLVLLDEPTDGVDPGGRRDIRVVMDRMREQGKTVFVNSHLLSELEAVSDRVAILVAGRVARQGTIDELTVAKQRYEIEVADPAAPGAANGTTPGAPPGLPAPPAPIAAITEAISPFVPGLPPPTNPSIVARGKLPTGEWVELLGPVIRVGTTDPQQIQPLLDALRARGLAVRRVQTVRPSLEDLFMEAVDTGTAAPKAAFPASAAMAPGAGRGAA
jgi:ABC-2 type transport system ATP-binding protein